MPTVFLHVDFSVPLDAVRTELSRQWPAIGCSHDVDANPIAAGVKKFATLLRLDSSTRHDSAAATVELTHASVADVRVLSIPTKYAAMAAVTYPNTANA